MLLDQLDAKDVPVFGVGKIFDVYLGRGIRRYEKTKSNAEGMRMTLEAMGEADSGLIFVNLVDFDMLYGHRNDVEGYARALEEVDAWVPSLRAKLRDRDLLIFTADHGCDPTTPSTDHTREYVPLLATGPSVQRTNLGTRASLSDIGQTVAENFACRVANGISFLRSIL
jgi:phosphopentomutase